MDARSTVAAGAGPCFSSLSSTFLRYLRALLILGRVSNLPTVWSNCLAGWWLGGDHRSDALPWLFSGASLLYTGGMFLNDACDAVFDREHRPERPIPSGHITRRAVWWWGLAMLLLGPVCLFWIGRTTGVLGLILTSFILLYDMTHKHITFAPVLMGSCRFVLYLVAASVGVGPVNGWAVWCGLVMGAYIVGLSCFARVESLRGPVRFWPIIMIASPIVLAWLMNSEGYRIAALKISLIAGLWCVKSIRYTFDPVARDIGRTVSGLLAGIVLVDWLAVVDAPRPFGFALVGLFGLAWLLQKVVPAT
jgi:hypothetical protein